jgi:RNA polymerase sigma factor (sigma-70 family)
LNVRRIGLPVEQLPDETLLAGLRSGDEEITVAFVRRFQAKVFGIALAVLGDTAAAEDVAQQAFERAWKHAHTYDALRGSVGTWLAAITRNLAIDVSRVRRPVPVDTSELLTRVIGSGDSTEQAALAAESAGDLRKALRVLPEAQARAVVLAAIGGLSASQIAQSESIPLGTAKTRIRGGLHRLRDLLEQSETEND